MITRIVLAFISMHAITTAFTQNLTRIEELEAVIDQSDDSSRLAIYIELTRLYAESDSTTALNYVKDGLQLASKLNSGNATAEVLLNAGFVYYQQLLHDKASYFYDQADSIFAAENNISGRSETSWLKGHLQLSQGQRPESFTHFRKSLEFAEISGETADLMRAYAGLGFANYKLANYDSALHYYFKVLPYCNEKSNDFCLELFNYLGIAYSEIKEQEKAMDFHKRAYYGYSQNGDLLNLGNSLMNIAGVFFFISDFDSTEYYLQKAIEVYDETGNIKDQTIGNNNLCALLIEQGHYKESITPGLRAIELSKQMNDQAQLLMAYMNTSHSYLKSGQLSTSVSYLDSLEHILFAVKSKYYFSRYYLTKLELAKARGNFIDALEFQRLQFAYEDSMVNEQKNKQIAELETRFETNKKEQQLELQASVLREKELELQLNRTLVAGLVLLVITGAIIVFLYLKRQSYRQKISLQEERSRLKDEQLEAVISSQEDERKRFAMDLHDEFGQLLSTLRLIISGENGKTSNTENSRPHQWEEIIDKMYNSLKSVAFNIMPQTLMEKSLVDALDELIDQINRLGELELTIRSFGKNHEMNTQYKIATYRIVQELITNIIKYAGATKVEINLTEHEDELNILIEDNGEGFDVFQLKNGSGNGWKNIQSRLDLMNGSIEYDSQTGRKGSTVIIKIPVPGTHKIAA